jgi:hypothetical protein
MDWFIAFAAGAILSHLWWREFLFTEATSKPFWNALMLQEIGIFTWGLLIVFYAWLGGLGGATTLWCFKHQVLLQGVELKIWLSAAAFLVYAPLRFVVSRRLARLRVNWH